MRNEVRSAPPTQNRPRFNPRQQKMSSNMPTNRQKYCWIHGWRVVHSRQECRTPARVHQRMDSTSNTMNGSNRGYRQVLGTNPYINREQKNRVRSSSVSLPYNDTETSIGSSPTMFPTAPPITNFNPTIISPRTIPSINDGGKVTSELPVVTNYHGMTGATMFRTTPHSNPRPVFPMHQRPANWVPGNINEG